MGLVSKNKDSAGMFLYIIVDCPGNAELSSALTVMA
jgi:hypothetical protein